MKFWVDSLDWFNDWRYNLLLAAPSKGEAKKTVSLGFIRIEALDIWGGGDCVLSGMATDDIFSLHSELPGKLLEEPKTFWISPEKLKGINEFEPHNGGFIIDFPEDASFDEAYDVMFWVEFVERSLYGDVTPLPAEWIQVSPERLRKFSLLKPVGEPLLLGFVEWNGWSIIRWTTAYSQGIYVPLERG